MKNMIQKKNLLTVGLILFLGVMLFLAACSDSPSNGDTNVNTNENESTDNANGGSVNGGKIKIAFTEGLHAFAPSSEIRTQIDAILSGTALEKLGRYEG